MHVVAQRVLSVVELIQLTVHVLIQVKDLKRIGRKNVVRHLIPQVLVRLILKITVVPGQVVLHVREIKQRLVVVLQG